MQLGWTMADGEFSPEAGVGKWPIYVQDKKRLFDLTSYFVQDTLIC